MLIITPGLDRALDVVKSPLKSGAFPIYLEQALVQPRIKNLTLDPDQLKSYRVQTHLQVIPYISKVTERVVAKRFISYANTSDLLPIHQLAYRQNFSIEDTSYDLFYSYLTDCHQLFVHNDQLTTFFPLDCSVPQGSVLGPLEFIAYTEDICKKTTVYYLV